MKITIPLISVILLLTACASEPLTVDSAKELNGRTLTISSRTPAVFEARSPGTAVGAVFGVIGKTISGSVTEIGGAQFLANSGISDPSNDLALKIGREMGDRYKLLISDDRPNVTSKSHTGVANELSGRDLLLDIKTSSWGYSYYTSGSNQYGPIYIPILRLVDAKRSKLVAFSICAEGLKFTPDAPTFDELVANNGAKYKVMLDKLVEICAHKFRGDMLLK